MPDYNRTTRECSFASLQPELVAAIREYVAQRELGNIESQVVLCCETTSERTKKRGLLSGLHPDMVHYTGVVVTPTWLIWASTNSKQGTVVLSARLAEIEVKEFDTSLIEDSGLEVFGFVGGFSQRVTSFIGLGQEPASLKLKEVLMEGIQQAKGSGKGNPS